jgi:hypothetical protein
MKAQPSQSGTAELGSGFSPQPKRIKSNTSGFPGVSWSKAAGKWEAHLRVDGVRHYLGLFLSAEDAYAAYLDARARYLPPPPDLRAPILQRARDLYLAEGIKGLAVRRLARAGLGHGKLRRVGFTHAGLLEALGVIEEYANQRQREFAYRGVTKPRWTWGRTLEVAGELVAEHGDLPTVQWCRLNGYSHLTNIVHGSDRTWEDLRSAIGLPPSARFYESRSGLRWLSRPEASTSNFLYARGIEHKRGERYSADYSIQSGRRFGRYDLHFRSAAGPWINVEIWGDIPEALAHGRYQETRARKEAYHADDPSFLGINYVDCLSDERLTELLRPYIGTVEPFQFDKPTDPFIETAHWTDADELLESCRQLAAQMPSGVFPAEDWLRKRGRHADRAGPAYNTMAQYVRLWIGGTRKVRQLLGQPEASTIEWTRDRAIEAWQDFEARHGLTPSQCRGKRRSSLPVAMAREADRVHEACRRLGVVDQARRGKTARQVIWTLEHTLAEWQRFCREHGRTPTQCMSRYQRSRLPRAISDEATRIYGAARRLGILEQAKSPEIFLSNVT